MSQSKTETDKTKRIDFNYQRNRLPEMQRVEQSVCGCNYGGTSWATKHEVIQISKKLALQPGHHLLDLGAGSGWPGLYLATLTGCDITLVDQSSEGLSIALDRASMDQLPGKCRVQTADVRDLPYDEHSFDAITHSDVLCCLPGKQQVLEECRRTIHPDGKMIFSVISMDPGLKGADYTQAVDFGPPFVEISARISYEDMLSQTCWNIIEKIDYTVQFLKSLKTYLKLQQNDKEQLTCAMGEEEYLIRLEKHTNLIDLISRGNMRRDVYCVLPV